MSRFGGGEEAATISNDCNAPTTASSAHQGRPVIMTDTEEEAASSSMKNKAPASESRKNVASLFQPFFLQLSQSKTLEEQHQHWNSLIVLLQRLKEEDDIEDMLSLPMGDREWTLLHTVCMCDPPFEVVKYIVDVFPQATELADAKGMLPLHVACSFRADPEIIQLLISISPQSVSTYDQHRRVPLHHILDPTIPAPFAQEQYPGTRPKRLRVQFPPLSILQALSSSSSQLVSSQDVHGRSPLDLLSFLASRLKVYDEIGRRHAQDIAELFLNCEPQPRTCLMASLQSFPPWLLEQACQNSYVRQTLNQASKEPLFAMGFLLDFLMDAFLLGVFMIGIRSFHSPLIVMTVMSGVFIGLVYFTLRLVMKLSGFARIKRMGLWVRDGWNWFDVLHVLLVAMLIVRREVVVEDGDMHMASVVTGALQYVKLLSDFRTVSVSFSVFLSAALRIFIDLQPFMVTTLLLLGAFAYSYFGWNVIRGNCIQTATNTTNITADMEEFGFEGADEPPYCTPDAAMLAVFGMFVGATETSVFTYDKGHLYLTIIFSFLMVILQLNILIAVINDSYAAVKQRGESVFWMERFYYIANLESVRRAMQCRDVPSTSTLSSVKLEKMWCWIDAALTPPSPQEQQQEIKQTPMWVRMVRSVKKLGVFVIACFWLVIGLISMGWLWPPQVREWLFCPPVEHSSQTEDGSSAAYTQMILVRETKAKVEVLAEQMSANDEQLDQARESMESLKRKKEAEQEVLDEKMGLLEERLGRLERSVRDQEGQMAQLNDSVDKIQGLLQLLLSK